MIVFKYRKNLSERESIFLLMAYHNARFKKKLKIMHFQGKVGAKVFQIFIEYMHRTTEHILQTEHILKRKERDNLLQQMLLEKANEDELSSLFSS